VGTFAIPKPVQQAIQHKVLAPRVRPQANAPLTAEESTGVTTNIPKVPIVPVAQPIFAAAVRKGDALYSLSFTAYSAMLAACIRSELDISMTDGAEVEYLSMGVSCWVIGLLSAHHRKLVPAQFLSGSTLASI